MYDHWLGGKVNFAADRIAGDRALAVTPGLRCRVRANRAFLGRTVRYLTAEAGIRQFLDFGTGIPSADNTDEVAHGIAADARIVYVDNDPIVLRHAQALMRGTQEGATTYMEADLRDPAPIPRQAAATLDFRRRSTSVTRRPPGSAPLTRTSRPRRRCGPATRFPGSSPEWSSSRRGSSRCTSGTRTGGQRSGRHRLGARRRRQEVG